MKKKLILLIMLLMLLISKVEAKDILASDVENNSYIIGKVLYTRKPNTDNNYTGSLSTPYIMKAAKTINKDSMDDMIIYHKTFLGQWINGLTGESITPPTYFSIESRNLKDILPNPEINCKWVNVYSNHEGANCESSFTDNNNNLISSYDIDDGFEKNYGVEFYELKDSNGNYPQPGSKVRYISGSFSSGNTTYIPTLIDLWNYNYSKNNFVNIVSRFYYLDGEEKIYSEYTNIENNGFFSVLGLTSNDIPRLTSSLLVHNDGEVVYDIGFFIDERYPTEPIFYNVEFELTNVKTDLYNTYRYDVYRFYPQIEHLDAGDFSRQIMQMPEYNYTYLYMCTENSVNKKYKKLHFFPVSTESALQESRGGGATLAASVNGYYPIQTIDISDRKAYSIPFEDEENEMILYYMAKVQVCGKNNEGCYNIITPFSLLYIKN